MIVRDGSDKRKLSFKEMEKQAPGLRGQCCQWGECENPAMVTLGGNGMSLCNKCFEKYKKEHPGDYR